MRRNDEYGHLSRLPYTTMARRLSLYSGGGGAIEIPKDLDPKVVEHIGTQAVDKFKGTLPKPLEKYELKLPDKAVLPADALERTAAIARKLGLSSNEHAQQLIDFTNGESKALIDATLAGYRPGGAAFEAQQNEWKRQALEASDIGGGKPEVLQSKVALVTNFVKKYFPEAAQKLINEHGLGSNPDFFRAILKLGELAKEDGFVTGNSGGGSKKSMAEKIYGDDKK